MKAEALRDDIIAGCVEFAWDRWTQLGVSGNAPDRRDERAADPEALLLFTLEVGRSDPRLFDEALDWLATNQHLISVQRLRNLCASKTDTALVNASMRATLRTPTASRSKAERSRSEPVQPLFRSVPPPRGMLDKSFESSGFARPTWHASGKSQSPRVLDPISFAFRMRRLLGVGVRAEIVRTLLTIRAPQLSSRIITADALFSQRNVREGLLQLVEAGVINVGELADDRYYSIDHANWASLLGFATTPDLPLHHNWVPTLRATTQIVRWLQQPGLDEVSPYLRASNARTLIDGIAADLQNAGVPLGAFTRRGADFWDDFAEIARMLLRSARGQR